MNQDWKDLQDNLDHEANLALRVSEDLLVNKEDKESRDHREYRA